ncbi:hypothetical protein ACIRRA_37680 [Nocardia sp. NPDC101769]|uniref:hypothetical protein n=1 Tax=Nocardia sp. NPDC101769 TaxID=3364333 RepID=UPI0038246B98
MSRRDEYRVSLADEFTELTDATRAVRSALDKWVDGGIAERLPRPERASAASNALLELDRLIGRLNTYRQRLSHAMDDLGE